MNLKYRPALLGLSILLSTVGFAGCDPIVPYQDRIDVPAQITLADPWLQGKTRVTILPPTRLPGGQLKIALDVRNVVGETLSLDYSGEFLDERGMRTGIPVAAAHFRVPPFGSTPIEITSTSAEARDFRIYIRRAQ